MVYQCRALPRRQLPLLSRAQAYAQHSLTSADNSYSAMHGAMYDPSPVSPSRYSFDRTDASGAYVPPPPPATFPPSPPASPHASPRLMHTLRSMPVAGVRHRQRARRHPTPQ